MNDRAVLFLGVHRAWGPDLLGLGPDGGETRQISELRRLTDDPTYEQGPLFVSVVDWFAVA